MKSLALRQVARRLGVSLAAVRSWQRQGLLHQVQCPFCTAMSVPAETVERMAGAAA